MLHHWDSAEALKAEGGLTSSHTHFSNYCMRTANRVPPNPSLGQPTRFPLERPRAVWVHLRAPPSRGC